MLRSSRQSDPGLLRHPRGQPVRGARRAEVDQGEHPGVEKLNHRQPGRRWGQESDGYS